MKTVFQIRFITYKINKQKNFVRVKIFEKNFRE